MNSESQRIGDFTMVTTPCVIGSIAAAASIGFVAWCWSQSLADSESLSWLVTGLVTAAGIPLAIGSAYWALSNFVIWVAVGDELTFATPVGSQTLAWETLRGIEFETEAKMIPLVVLPVSIKVGEHVIALITLGQGRELRGRISHDDAVLLHALLRQYPKLDTLFVQSLASPRAAMMTFVDAVMEEDLGYAAMFLDFSTLDTRTEDNQAASCARKLKEVIDRVWFIDYEEVPDDPDYPSPYILAAGSDQEIAPEFRSVVEAIKIGRDSSSGFWRFEPETVRMIVTEFLQEDQAGS